MFNTTVSVVSLVPSLTTLIKIVDPQVDHDQAPAWLSTVSFLLGGVLLAIVASFGLIGNILSFIILSTQAVHKTFHNLLLLLSIYDMVSTQQFPLIYISPLKY